MKKFKVGDRVKINCKERKEWHGKRGKIKYFRNRERPLAYAGVKINYIPFNTDHHFYLKDLINLEFSKLRELKELVNK